MRPDLERLSDRVERVASDHRRDIESIKDPALRHSLAR